MRLELYRPVVGTGITQGFGENKSCVDRNGKIVGTRNGNCPANTKPYYKSVGLLGHNGLDVKTMHGENVHHCATFTGKMQIEKDLDGGIGVDIVSQEPLFFPGPIPAEIKDYAVKVDGGFTCHVKMRYWHLKTPIGWNDKIVTPGTLIGLADNTGKSSGDHLHWSPKWCREDGRGIGQSNGYFGAFDPMPYYNHTNFIRDLPPTPPIPVPVPLTPQEKKEIASALSTVQKVVLYLRELIALRI